jgi:hypothetical protein
MNPTSDSTTKGAVSRITLLAGVLVVVGGLLAVTVDMVFVVVFGAGVFGPGVLREVGLLDDQDEFQREAARTAGYRAYLAAGLVLVVWLAVVRRGTPSIEGDLAMTVTMALLLLIVVWLLSSLLAFWGPVRATSTILLAFGSFWLLFILLSHVSEPGNLLIEILVAAPFFILAWAARRWPRPAGAILVLVGAFAFFAFDMHEAFQSRMNAWPVILTMFVPLMACGIALLRLKNNGGPGAEEAS